MRVKSNHTCKTEAEKEKGSVGENDTDIWAGKNTGTRQNQTGGLRNLVLGKKGGGRMPD
jgi:hypothetical protein